MLLTTSPYALCKLYICTYILRTLYAPLHHCSPAVHHTLHFPLLRGMMLLLPHSCSCLLCVQLTKSQDLLKLSQQPYHYLLEGMKARDEQIGAQAKAMEDMERRLAALKEERGRLVKERNDAAADLERLLAHKEVCT